MLVEQLVRVSEGFRLEDHRTQGRRCEGVHYEGWVMDTLTTYIWVHLE